MFEEGEKVVTFGQNIYPCAMKPIKNVEAEICQRFKNEYSETEKLEDIVCGCP